MSSSLAPVGCPYCPLFSTSVHSFGLISLASGGQQPATESLKPGKHNRRNGSIYESQTSAVNSVDYRLTERTISSRFTAHFARVWQWPRIALISRPRCPLGVLWADCGKSGRINRPTHRGGHLLTSLRANSFTRVKCAAATVGIASRPHCSWLR
jgi:hypothetical protein